MRRLLALLSLLVLCVTPAVAAEPERGEVSKASPKVSWEGAITSFQSWQLYNQGQGQCLRPSCDTFTLEVKGGDAASQLNVTVESGDSTIFVEVVKPDGSKELYSGATKAAGKIKNPAPGTYTINVAQNEQTQATHKGTAELVFPAATPPAPPGGNPPGIHNDPGAPAQPTTLTVKAGKRKGKTLPVTIEPSAPITNVTATLARGKKVVAKGSLARAEGSTVLKLKLKGKPRRGKHTLKVTGVDGQGQAVSRSLTVKI